MSHATHPHDMPGILPLFRRSLALLPAGARAKLGVIMAITLVTAISEVVFAALVALFVASLINPSEVLNSSYMTRAVDLLGVPRDLITPKNILAVLGLSSILAVAFKNLCRGWLRYYESYTTQRYCVALSARMLNTMLSMPYRWLAGQNSSDILTHVSWAQTLVKFVDGAILAVCELITLAFMLTALLLLDPLSVLVVLAFLGAVCFLLYAKLKKWHDRVAYRIATINKLSNRQTTKAVHGYKDVKVFGCLHFFVKEYLRHSADIPALMARQTLLKSAPPLILETMGIGLLCLLTVYMLLIQEGSSAKITGSLIFLGITVWRGLPSFVRGLNQFTNIRAMLPQVVISLDNFDQLPARIREQEPDPEPLPLETSLRFDDVSLFYDGSRRPALDKVSFDLKKGETYGIVGKSGAGKSTLVDILIGLMPPDQGRVLVNGEPLDQDTERWLRNIGYVAQEPYIYDGTLLQNVAFGYDPKEIDEQWVLECCRMAAVTDFLDDLPQGLDTPIGERGARLSGGQRQRVVIARALHRAPSLIVFDEATSSLDTKSEAEIQQTMYGLKGSMTMVIVAHRLSTVENCDRILWLDKGRVAMVGAPEEVLPAYRRTMTATERPEADAGSNPG